MNRSLKQPSYEGKDLFIGIDVHKRTYSVAVVMEGARVKKWQTLADPVKLAHQLTDYFPKALLHSVYEAGFSGFILHRPEFDKIIDFVGFDERIRVSDYERIGLSASVELRLHRHLANAGIANRVVNLTFPTKSGY